MQIRYDQQNKEWSECISNEERKHSKRGLKKTLLTTGDIKECLKL